MIRLLTKRSNRISEKDRLLQYTSIKRKSSQEKLELKNFYFEAEFCLRLDLTFWMVKEDRARRAVGSHALQHNQLSFGLLGPIPIHVRDAISNQDLGAPENLLQMYLSLLK